MSWLALALISAFSMATVDAVTKKGFQGYRAIEIVAVRYVFAAVILSPMFIIYPIPSIPAAFWPSVAVLIPLEVLAISLYVWAIRDNPLALSLPYLAFTPVFATLTGFVVLGETIAPAGSAGIGLVVVGAYVLNVGEVAGEVAGDEAGTRRVRRWRRVLMRPLRAAMRERGARLMLAVAFLYSLTTVIAKGLLQYVPVSFLTPFYVLTLAVTVVAGLAAGRPGLWTPRPPDQPAHRQAPEKTQGQACGVLACLWRRPVWHLALGLALALTMITHLAAIKQVEAAYMLAVKRTSLLFGICYGAILFGEEHLGLHLAGGALMVAGVGLIALQ